MLFFIYFLEVLHVLVFECALPFGGETVEPPNSFITADGTEFEVDTVQFVEPLHDHFLRAGSFEHVLEHILAILTGMDIVHEEQVRLLVIEGIGFLQFAQLFLLPPVVAS